MEEGSVWFRAAIGRRKNAEARWLLPMICRRGGIEKQDIGAIRILDTTTEFEISARVAESFAVKVQRPDKEDNIRIEALAAAPRDSKPRHGSEPGFDQRPAFKKKKPSRDNPVSQGSPATCRREPPSAKRRRSTVEADTPARRAKLDISALRALIFRRLFDFLVMHEFRTPRRSGDLAKTGA
jgi:ATP-dependent RNA helicase DeaD